jgi:hypothetical protein
MRTQNHHQAWWFFYLGLSGFSSLFICSTGCLFVGAPPRERAGHHPRCTSRSQSAVEADFGNKELAKLPVYIMAIYWQPFHSMILRIKKSATISL